MEDAKELAIGEEGIIDGVKVRCVEQFGCDGCAFDTGDETCRTLNCRVMDVGVEKSVIYQEVK